MKKMLALIVLAAITALCGAAPALAREDAATADGDRATRGTPVELRFVLKEALPRGADLTIFYDTPRKAQMAYIDCQLGEDGVPDPDGRCQAGRYTETLRVPQGQKIKFEFAIEDPTGDGTRVVKEGSRTVGGEPLLIRAFYPER